MQVNLIKAFAILFFVLPALIAASACQVSVSYSLTSSGNRYNTYKATILNIGNVAVENVLLKPSEELHSVEGLEKVKGGYELPQQAGNIEIDESYTFTFTASAEGKSVSFSETTCNSASVTTRSHGHSSHTKATEAPKATHAPKATTTRKPAHTTTTKPEHTSTKAPSTSTKAPSTSTKAPSTSTTKAPSTSTKAPSTTTTKKPSSTSTTKAPSTTTTKAPSTSGGSPSTTGTKCPAGSWWAPSPMTTYQWQLTGTIDTSIDVQMYDIDLFDNTAATISTLHSQGRVVICYFSTQYEDWRPDASDFTAAVLGNGLDGWTGENYVDIRSTVVRNIMTARMDLAVTKGCDGLEPDNVDGYESDTGFPLTAADQLNFNEFIAAQAHQRSLSVGLKNDVDQGKTLEPFFDWALDEQCYEYDECNTLSSFITAGKAVFNTEYSGSAAKICPYMVGIQFSSLMKTLDLTAKINAQCCTYAPGGCAAEATYKCISAESSLMADSAPELETTPATVAVEHEFVASATTNYVSILVIATAALVALNL